MAEFDWQLGKWDRFAWIATLQEIQVQLNKSNNHLIN